MLPLKIQTLKSHSIIKKSLLKLIEETDSYIINHDEDEVCPLTDWENYEDKNGKDAKYWELFKSVAENKIIEVFENEWNFENVELDKYWFQQYTKKGEHGWHYHYGCLYHAIYYLELPEGTPPTLVRAPNGFEFTPNVKEGDILIMPSIMEHCSPPNESSLRKTIIAINIDGEH